MASHPSRDTFVYLLQFVTLAISSTALGNVWFALINRWTPAPGLSEQFYPQAITTGLSALVIASPVYLGISWWIRTAFTNGTMDPARSLRKWLVYFTVFLTAIIGLVDLIATLNTYLDGDFTMRFFLKALSILVIVGSIFSFYLWDIRRERPVRSSATQGTFAAVVAIVLVTIIAGFWVVGSPRTRRLLQWDRDRVNRLQLLAQDLGNRSVALPASQEEFNRDFQYSPSIRDPQTDAPFPYRRIDTRSFELCTQFFRPAESWIGREKPILTRPPGEQSIPSSELAAIQDHGAGDECFSFHRP